MANHYQSGSTVNNNTGVIRLGGNIANTAEWTNVPLGDGIWGAHGSALKSTMTGVHKAVSAGNFALMVKGTYVMRKVSTTLAGVANTTLRSGGSDKGTRRSIHKFQKDRATFLTGLQWSKAADGITVVFTKNTSETTLSTDEAATPTRAIPGELTYMTGDKTPTSGDYPEKTNG